MTSDFNRRQQVNFEQLKCLIEFLKENRNLAKGLIRGRRGKLQTEQIWNKCAKLLNNKNGAIKDGKGWSKYWCDWKYRVRRKSLELKVAQENDEEPPDSALPLSELETEVLNLVGEPTLKGVRIETNLSLSEEENSKEDDHCEMETRRRKRCHAAKARRRIKRSCSEVGTSDEGQQETSLAHVQDSNLNDREVAAPIQMNRRRRDLADNARQVQQFHNREVAQPVRRNRRPRYVDNNERRAQELNQRNQREEEDGLESNFLRIEQRKLENLEKMNESMAGICQHMSTICDILLQIRDAVAR